MILLKNKIRIWDVVFAVLGICAAALIVWKCRYGFANMDEAFYLTIPYRLCQGDGLFVQEWHLSQMSGFLLYPFMKFYLLTHGTMDGLFLTFRYYYTVIQILISVFIYMRLRNINRAGAGITALVFMLYAPFGIMALSYNSMGIMSLALSLTIMSTAKGVKWLQEMIAGLLFAAAVLCCPYLVIVYAVYMVAAVGATIWRKTKGRTAEDTVFYIRSWLFFSIGAAALAMVFAGFVLSRATISEILAAFPNIMNDVSHESKGLVQLFITYFKAVLSVSKAADLGYVFMVVSFIAALIDRKRKEHAAVYFGIATVSAVVAIIFMVWYGKYINFVMFPVNIMVPVCAAICWNKEIKRLLFVFWIPAILYTGCIHASSNMEFYAISSAASVALVPSLMIIAICAENIIKEKNNSVRIAVIICAVTILAGQLVTVAVMRYKAVFWGSMDILQSEAQREGVEKGLYLPDIAAEQYELTIKLSGYINEKYPGEKNLLLLSDNIWMYFQCPEKKNSSFSGWLSELEGIIEQNGIDKLLEYYKLNPQKIPDIVYMEKEYPDYIDDMETISDYNVTELEINGGYILERAE